MDLCSHRTLHGVLLQKLSHLKKRPKPLISKSGNVRIYNVPWPKKKTAKLPWPILIFMQFRPMLSLSWQFHVLENSWVIYITDHLWSLLYLLSDCWTTQKLVLISQSHHYQAVSKSWTFLYRFFIHWPLVYFCTELSNSDMIWTSILF